MATAVVDVVARDKTKRTMSGIERSLGKIAALGAAAFGVGQLTQYANSIQTITNRLKLVTNGQQQLNSTFTELTNVANRARQDLDAVTDLYQKIALSTKDLGLNQAQVTRTTETFTKLLSIAGAESGTAAGAIRQFAQALGSGAFRGDEFNSVVEAAPQILDILAAETGKARGEIRAMAADGKLTADVLINALLKASKDVDAQFAKTGPTIGQSFTVLKNNFLALGTSAAPVFNALAKGILFVANNLENAVVFATAFGASLAVGKVIAMTKAVGGLRVGIQALTVAMAKNPIGLIAVVAASAAVGIYNLIKPLLELEATLGTKILYALEVMANGFLNTFHGLGLAVKEFGSMFAQAFEKIFAFEDPTTVFDDFGTKMKKAFNKGFEKNRFKFVSDEERDDLEKQLAEIEAKKNAVATAGDSGYGTLTTGTPSGEIEKQGKDILSIEKSLLDEREAILREYNENKKALMEADEKAFEKSELGKKELLDRLEKEKTKLLTELTKKQAEEDKRLREEQIQNALKYVDEIKRLEYDKNEAIKEVGLLTEEALKEAGIDRATAIRNIEKKFEAERMQALKNQAEMAKKLALQQAIDKLKAEGHSASEADKIAKDQVANQKAYEEDKVGFVVSSLAKSMKAVGQYNEQAFKAAKALAIAEAIMNTYSMAVAAFKSLAVIPVIGPALGAAAAAAAIATGMAQVSAIRSQQYTGPREKGGPVGANQSYLVGEAGPEVLRMGPNAGTIIPNDQLGGGPVVVNFNISTVDAEGFDELLIRRRGTITGIINQAMEKRGKQGVIA